MGGQAARKVVHAVQVQQSAFPLVGPGPAAQVIQVGDFAGVQVVGPGLDRSRLTDVSRGFQSQAFGHSDRSQVDIGAVDDHRAVRVQRDRAGDGVVRVGQRHILGGDGQGATHAQKVGLVKVARDVDRKPAGMHQAQIQISGVLNYHLAANHVQHTQSVGGIVQSDGSRTGLAECRQVEDIRGQRTAALSDGAPGPQLEAAYSAGQQVHRHLADDVCTVSHQCDGGQAVLGVCQGYRIGASLDIQLATHGHRVDLVHPSRGDQGQVACCGGGVQQNLAGVQQGDVGSRGFDVAHQHIARRV